MIGVLLWLVLWTCRVGTIDFCPASAALASQVQNIIFLTVYFFTLATWAGKRPGSPVSVSLVAIRERTGSQLSLDLLGRG